MSGLSSQVISHSFDLVSMQKKGNLHFNVVSDSHKQFVQALMLIHTLWITAFVIGMNGEGVSPKSMDNPNAGMFLNPLVSPLNPSPHFANGFPLRWVRWKASNAILYLICGSS